MTEAFDPAGFLDIARKITQTQPTEAALRTAVSRAYYAVFLVARDKAAVDTRRAVHVTVIAAVRERRGFRTAGDQLEALRRLRTVADYDLLPADAGLQDWRENWLRANVLAEEVRASLETW